MPSGSPRISRLAPAALALAISASRADAACYADPGALKAAVRTIVASFKCPGFRQAIFGDLATRFLSGAGIIDQTTGSCRPEIASNVETLSVEVLSDEKAYCDRAAATLAADAVLREAARKVGAL